jgi:hypothetical protein
MNDPKLWIDPCRFEIKCATSDVWKVGSRRRRFATYLVVFQKMRDTSAPFNRNRYPTHRPGGVSRILCFAVVLYGTEPGKK